MVTVQEVVSGNGDIVNFVLVNGCSNLSYEDRYFLKQLERPTPSLVNLININEKTSNRKFCSSWYEKCTWLTGSEVKNKLYCWTCLLFNQNSKSPWHTTGIDNLKNLYKSIERHTLSKDHIHAAIKYKLFGVAYVQNSLDTGLRANVIKHNEAVKENREIMRRFIDMTIYLATQELLRGHNEIDTSQKQANFDELAEFLSTYDVKFEFLKSSSVITGMSKTIQNDLIGSVNHVVLRTIESEIQNSACFSWQIDETTDISCHSQTSVIFRFVHDGDVKERFLGFSDGSAGRSVDDLFNLLSERFERFDLKSKLVGQTYDGASVMIGDLNEFQERIKTIAPHALFTHCYAHNLNLVLQDSVSEIQECKLFFAALSGISAFFSQSAKRTAVLEKVCSRNAPETAESRWNFKSRLVNTVFKYRDELVEVFEEITKSGDFAKDSTTIRESIACLNFLNDFNTLFLLQVFDLVFQETDLTFSVVENRSNDVSYCKMRIQNLLQIIQTYRNEEHFNFNEIYDNTVSTLGLPSKRIKSELHGHDVSLHYKSVYNEILDVIRSQIEVRFANLESLKFFELLDTNKFATFNARFPEGLLNLLIRNYPTLFSKDKLEIELRILYSDATILGESSDIAERLKLMVENSLQDDIPELHILLSLILSLPTRSASAEGSFSCLKRIKNYCCSSMSKSRVNSLSLIAIERELVKSLRKSTTFFDEVIDHFAKSKNRRIMNLIYKQI